MKWYASYSRDLPWRKTKDPYIIWVSEIILQQTTIKQGIGYYHRFLKSFPTIQHLAQASEESVLKTWEGLGYYSRARNMLVAARHICDNLNGGFPKSYDALIKLKGIGPYTAAAISSAAFGEKRAVVDGNVIRVISRVFGIEDPVDKAETVSAIQDIASSLLGNNDPFLFNQSIMEFGALCCTYKSPSCSSCPLSSTCVAYAQNRIQHIPFKAKKIKKRLRYFHCFHIVDPLGNTIVQKRINKDVWKGLFQFPYIETEDAVGDLSFPDDIIIGPLKDFAFIARYKQQLTHQVITAHIYTASTNKIILLNPQSSYQIINQNDIRKYAFPKFIDLYLNDN